MPPAEEEVEHNWIFSADQLEHDAAGMDLRISYSLYYNCLSVFLCPLSFLF